MLSRKHGWGHSTWRQAARLAQEANVKRLVLFHHHPGHDDRFMKQLETEARAEFTATEVARGIDDLRVAFPFLPFLNRQKRENPETFPSRGASWIVLYETRLGAVEP